MSEVVLVILLFAISLIILLAILFWLAQHQLAIKRKQLRELGLHQGDHIPVLYSRTSSGTWYSRGFNRRIVEMYVTPDFILLTPRDNIRLALLNDMRLPAMFSFNPAAKVDTRVNNLVIPEKITIRTPSSFAITYVQPFFFQKEKTLIDVKILDPNKLDVMEMISEIVGSSRT